MVLILIACEQPSTPEPRPTPAPAPTEHSGDPDVETAMRNMGKLVDTAAKYAAAEREEKASQTEKLEHLIAEAQTLIAGGDLDRAEMKVADIQWQPDPTRSSISDTDAQLIKQYDERRETLKQTIQRKRAGH